MHIFRAGAEQLEQLYVAVASLLHDSLLLEDDCAHGATLDSSPQSGQDLDVDFVHKQSHQDNSATPELSGLEVDAGGPDSDLAARAKVAIAGSAVALHHPRGIQAVHGGGQRLTELQKAEFTQLIANSCTWHCLVPGALGSGRAALEHKAAAVLHQLSLVAESEVWLES